VGPWPQLEDGGLRKPAGAVATFTCCGAPAVVVGSWRVRPREPDRSPSHIPLERCGRLPSDEAWGQEAIATVVDAVACGRISRSMSCYAWPEPADASLSLSAIRAKSGSEDAFIFRIT